MDTITVRSSKNLFHAELFDIQEAELLLPNGKIKKNTYIDQRSTVSIFPLSDKYDVYLLNEYRYLYGKPLINAIAGYINPGEKPLQAARRELKEEAGIEAGQLEELIRVDRASSVVKGQSYIFLAKDLEIARPKPEEDELLRLIKIPLAEAAKKILSGQITISSTIIGILLLDKLKKEKKL